MSKTEFYVYRQARRWWDFPYTIMARRPWPDGTVVTVCTTKRGARRKVRKLVASGWPPRTSPTLIESTEEAS